MGTDSSIRIADVSPFHHSTYRLSCPYRNSSAAVHGTHRITAGEETYLDISLFSIRTMEHNNNILGMQCYRRRRNICSAGKLAADVPHIRIIPPK